MCLLIIGAPLLAAQSNPLLSSIIYLLLSSACHQMPERSFAILGHPWGVCQRCAGIYLGLFAASLVSPRVFCAYRTPGNRRLPDGVMRVDSARMTLVAPGSRGLLRSGLSSGIRLCAAGINVRMAHSSAQMRRIWLATGCIPILADALLPLGGLWASTPLSRLLSGLVFGFLLSTLLVAGVTELFRDILNSPQARVLNSHGGES
ncbi:MAG: DUF2085 domain-containing protein [Acidobacteria bacterium]|nr:DUF2085 domain-containing protein [Acidobacteriota bacterium]